MKNNTVIKPIMAIVIFALFLAFCFDLSTESIRNPGFCFLIVCTILTIVIFRNNFPKTAVFYTMLTGMLLKLAYVVYTPVWCRQHDVVDFGAGEGHAAYMEYILSHKALPDFDPRSVWAFFQPPLHHLFSAVWMWFNIRMGIPENRMHKNVQILPLCYMCILMLVVYLICKELNMRRGILVTMLAVSFHPIFILMSGSINNDALAVLLTVISIYIAILWYMYPTTGKIVLLAVSIGLAMSAKLSSALVAPPIGLLMICKCGVDTGKFKDKAKTISYLLEFLAFAVIVFPLGLWWPVRNKVLFNMPVNYIPEVGEQVAKRGPVPTFFDVRTESPFLYMKSNGFAYDEYNLILATIKSSLFGEGDFARISAAVNVLGWILFALAVIVLILQITAMIRTCISKEAGPDPMIKMFLCATFIIFLAGYLLFAIKGANLSAMNYRYSAASVAVLAIFAGLMYDREEVLGRKVLRYVLMGATSAFAIVSCLFYLVIGLYVQ
ncbi:MAG: phospholipid carrier-dependent glycosyltransferase [Lachnospiraceae bacterium]|nr:phospholipid carrier-dependent glycosyltransferase [Lachnospiraceae bacterium]